MKNSTDMDGGSQVMRIGRLSGIPRCVVVMLEKSAEALMIRLEKVAIAQCAALEHAEFGQ